MIRRKLAILLAGMALAVAGVVGFSASPASADLPPASYTCSWGGTQLGQTNPTVAYAAYDMLNSNYVRAACWTRDSIPPYVDCTFYVYIYAPQWGIPPFVVETGGGCNP